ncbi:MAG TPA: hypothetical protein DCZ01_12245 [Elusimicrobia bacterium]|nr:hypothetical protein [Elusimicrobiota bacterium]
MNTIRCPLNFVLVILAVGMSSVIHGAGTMVPGKAGGASFSPTVVQDWTNSIGEFFGSQTPDLMTLNPILSSLRGVDLSDPKTREALAPVYAAVQSQVQTLQANVAPALGTPANPALATKYVAADILGNFQLPETRSQVAELSRAYHDALPIEEKERIRAGLVMLHMESIVKALGRMAMDDARIGGSPVSGFEVNASAGIGSHKIIIPLQCAVQFWDWKPHETLALIRAYDVAGLSDFEVSRFCSIARFLQLTKYNLSVIL